MPLFERGEELVTVSRWVDELVEGRGRVGLVEGEAGIGKSTLVSAAASHAARAGVSVLEAAGEELEGDRPFGVVLQALSSAAARSPLVADVVALARKGPSPGADPATFRFRVIDGAVDALEALALARPLLVVVEDVQWADAPSVVTLHRLARRGGELPLLVVMTARPLPRRAELHRLAGAVSNAGNVVVLHPLSREGTLAMAANALDARVGQVLSEKLSGTGGNPLFIRELVEILDREGRLKWTEGTVEVGADVLPLSLRVAILRRMSFLPRSTFEVLKVASVLGSSFAVDDLAVALDRNVTAVLPALDEARAARVLLDAGEKLRFAHDLFREAIYEEMSLGEQRALHAQAGFHLARRGAPLGRVADHLVRGAAPGDSEAVGWLRRAARDVGPKAPGAAADLLMRGREVAGITYPERNELASELVHWLVLAERFVEGERLGRELLAEDPCGPRRWRVSRDVALALCFQGRVEEGIDVYDSLLADPSLTEAERATVLADVALARTWTVGRQRVVDPASAWDQAVSEAEEARVLADRLGDRNALTIAMFALAKGAWVRGDLTRAAEVAAEACRLSAGASPEVRIVSPHALLAGILRDAERGEEAEEAARTARLIAQDLGDVYTLGLMQLQDGGHHWATGEWDDAIAELEAVLALCQESGRPHDPFAVAFLTHMAIHRGNVRTATQLISELPAMAHPMLVLVLPLLEEARGDLQEAVRLVGEIDPSVFWAISFYGPFFLPDLVRLCLAGGDMERAALMADALAETAERTRTKASKGAALQAKGLVEDDVQLLLQAVDVLRKAPRPILRALACEDAAAALDRSGRRQEALELVREALGLYQAVGSDRDLRRASSKARAHGAAKGVRGPRRRGVRGWESITATERRVIDLVGEGLPNRLIAERMFISPRTVESHLGHIFRKLDLSSRSELVVRITRRGRP